jgi:hypothetical protein
VAQVLISSREMPTQAQPKHPKVLIVAELTEGAGDQ